MGRATRLTHLPRGKKPVHIARLGGYYNLKGYRHAHAWIGNTKGICDYLTKEGLPPERVFHIGNFVDTAPPVEPQELFSLKEEWAIPIDAYIVLGLGRLHPNKGFDQLLNAFSKLPDNLHNRPLHLVIVGDGPLNEELRNAANQLGISNRVTWAGWQYNPSPWYQMANVFVCSSRHEPLGNVILEAWANKTPVISTMSEGPLEIITPNEDALLVPLNNLEHLTASIRETIELDDAHKNKMTNAGFAKLNSSFSEEAIVSMYINMYENV
jgi:glycosyltransferase involved in cell wall biosynthesis